MNDWERDKNVIHPEYDNNYNRYNIYIKDIIEAMKNIEDLDFKLEGTSLIDRINALENTVVNLISRIESLENNKDNSSTEGGELPKDNEDNEIDKDFTLDE
jgi:hypothetical protein